MADYYILVDREPIQVDMMTWARATERQHTIEGFDAWRVGATYFEDGTWISSVFLGLDHNWHPDGPPLIFETMIFNSDDDLDEEWCERCSTWDECLIQHREAILVAVKTHGQPTESKLFGVL